MHARAIPQDKEGAQMLYSIEQNRGLERGA